MPVRSGDDEKRRKLERGALIAGKYRVDGVIGEGGMGVVIAATHLKLDERVAIKCLLPSAKSTNDAVRRFEREARAAVKIKSEHVARVIDVGSLDDGSPYIVMEHLEGCDLGQIVKASGPLAIEDAVEYVVQACEALAEAHALGIIHRDLKPGNLFLTRRTDGSRSIKLLDFGISKLISAQVAEEATLTNEDSFLGSPTYMSPEQMSDPKCVDTRTDLWSLGATTYRIVTGKPPFDGDSMPQLCGMILSGKGPPPLSSLRSDVPPGLDAAIARCLTRDPVSRFANVADLAAALAPFGPPAAAQSALRAARILETAGFSANVPVAIVAPWEPTPSPVARSRAAEKTYSTWTRTRGARSAARHFRQATAALVIFGIGAGVGTFVLRRHREAASSASATVTDAPPAVVARDDSTAAPATAAPATASSPVPAPTTEAAATVVAPPTTTQVATQPTATATAKRPSTPPHSTPKKATAATSPGPTVAPKAPAPRKPEELFDDR